MWNIIQKEFCNILFNALFRIGLEIYLDMMFCSVLNLHYYKLDSSMDTYSTTLSAVILFLGVIFTLVVTLCSFFREKLDSEDGRFTFNALFESMREDSDPAKFIHLIFMSRRLILITLLVFLTISGLGQTILLGLVTLANT